jgi:2-polyprenyl-6-methoxyphenol hydroxylase-like FAD-dependent oxidoreductase
MAHVLVCGSGVVGLTAALLLAAGGCWIDPLASLPPSIEDRSPRPGDERLRWVNARRPVIESAYAQAAAEHPGVDVQRGARVRSPLVDLDRGVPHVRGVVLDDGAEIGADLVVDAMGRRSKLVEWLADLGATAPPVESEDSGFACYTGYLRGPDVPAAMGPRSVRWSRSRS